MRKFFSYFTLVFKPRYKTIMETIQVRHQARTDILFSCLYKTLFILEKLLFIL